MTNINFVFIYPIPKQLDLFFIYFFLPIKAILFLSLQFLKLFDLCKGLSVQLFEVGILILQ
jgi:hypothetical protein